MTEVCAKNSFREKKDGRRQIRSDILERMENDLLNKVITYTMKIGFSNMIPRLVARYVLDEFQMHHQKLKKRQWTSRN